MKSTLMGILRVDPKKIFEEGIRRELVSHVVDTLDQNLVFNPKAKVNLFVLREQFYKRILFTTGGSSFQVGDLA
jgi:Hereditary spastic paraplegia protein strumpellin